MGCWGSMQYQRQTKRSTSPVPWEKRVKRRHGGQYLPSYKCCKEPRRLPEVKKKKSNDVKAGMWPLCGSSVAGDDVTTAAVIHRLPDSPSTPPHGKVRSEERWSPASWTFPFLEGQPTRWSSLPYNKRLKCLQGKPLCLLSHSDILVCGSSLSSLISLQSLSVCSVITRPPVYVKKGLILPVVLITALFNFRFDWLKMVLRLGQMLGRQVKLITDLWKKKYM